MAFLFYLFISYFIVTWVHFNILYLTICCTYTRIYCKVPRYVFTGNSSDGIIILYLPDGWPMDEIHKFWNNRCGTSSPLTHLCVRRRRRQVFYTTAGSCCRPWPSGRARWAGSTLLCWRSLGSWGNPSARNRYSKSSRQPWATWPGPKETSTVWLEIRMCGQTLQKWLSQRSSRMLLCSVGLESSQYYESCSPSRVQRDPLQKYILENCTTFSR